MWLTLLTLRAIRRDGVDVARLRLHDGSVDRRQDPPLRRAVVDGNVAVIRNVAVHEEALGCGGGLCSRAGVVVQPDVAEAVVDEERSVGIAGLLFTWGCAMDLSRPLHKPSPFVSTATVVDR